MALDVAIKGSQKMERWVTSARKIIENGEVLNLYIATATADGGTMNGRQVKGVIRYIHDNASRYHKTAKALKANYTNYYEGAASGVELLIAEHAAGLIFTRGTGMIARAFKASIIKPGNGKKYLTIPAIAEAYGKRAGEFGSRLKFEPRGKNLGVLVWRTPNMGGTRTVRDSTSTGPAKAATARTARTAKTSSSSTETRAVVVFWCVRQIKQKRDRTILPSDKDLRTLVMIGCRRAVRSIAESPLALSS